MTVYKIKRIYESPTSDDGYRVLVDRLWPRGISKEWAALDEWAKEIAPANELRQWFNHDPEKFTEFSERYRKELDENTAAIKARNDWTNHPTVTLLYSAKDVEFNQAVVLKQWLEKTDFNNVI
ncbi:DUF488 domain-containing protein [TM7 phylum sp. oral taxon 348]|nr:DUF488 domain-containing protein [TM7 phylum sp. oral taxon 348]